jgi:hypothetical protein
MDVRIPAFLGRCLTVLAVVWAVALAGCATKLGVVEPPAPVPGGIRIEAGVVKWSTDIATRASVRYGYRAGKYDHMAYPQAAGRRDRAYLTQHEVPLLDLRVGETLYFQTLSEPAPGGTSVYSPEQTHVPAVTGPADQLFSTMIHIGFGDSHLITFPNGKHFLIDGGEGAAASAVDEFLTDHNVTTIDAAMATHIHYDHIGGLIDDVDTTSDGLLAIRPPGVFFDSPQKVPLDPGAFPLRAYADALDTNTAQTTPVVVLQRGQTSANVPALALDARVLITVLNSGTSPGYRLTGHEGTDINNDSIVLKLTYGDVDFVIGGDAEDASESSMVNGSVTGDVEYYKVHHHGLQDATSSGWMSMLSPRVAFIPNTQQAWSGSLPGALAESTQRLRTIGAHIYVIDDAPTLGVSRASGAQHNVTFATDGVSYEVRLELARQTAPSKPRIHED